MARMKRRGPIASTPANESMNPFVGKTGFFNRLNRVAYTVTGPAQVGIGRPEAPHIPPTDPRCPVCGQFMSLHTVDRSGERTHLHCPTQQ